MNILLYVNDQIMVCWLLSNLISLRCYSLYDNFPTIFVFLLTFAPIYSLFNTYFINLGEFHNTMLKSRLILKKI